jgi:hypothetical protein
MKKGFEEIHVVEMLGIAMDITERITSLGPGEFYAPSTVIFEYKILLARAALSRSPSMRLNMFKRTYSMPY